MQAIIRYRRSSGSTPTRMTNATRCTPSTPTRSTTGTAPPIKRSRPKQPGSRFQAPRTRRESQEPSAVLQLAHPGRPGRRHPLHLDGVRHGRSSVRVWLPLEGRHAPWACGLGTARFRLDSPPVTFDGTVTLHPSIGNGQLPCRSHYFIRHDRLDWLRPISAAATRAAGIRDRAVHIDRKPQPSTKGTSRGGCAFWSGEGSRCGHLAAGALLLDTARNAAKSEVLIPARVWQPTDISSLQPRGRGLRGSLSRLDGSRPSGRRRRP